MKKVVCFFVFLFLLLGSSTGQAQRSPTQKTRAFAEFSRGSRKTLGPDRRFWQRDTSLVTIPRYRYETATSICQIYVYRNGDLIFDFVSQGFVDSVFLFAGRPWKMSPRPFPMGSGGAYIAP